VTPECVAPGELVTLTLTVMQPEKAERLNVAAVTATLPAELQWLPQRSEWLYTDASRELRTALPTLDAGSTATYSLQFRADGKPGQTVEVLFALVDAEGVQTTSRASVWVSLPAQAEVDARGGRLQSADGRVQVAFPESVVTQAATVIHTPRFQRTVEGRGAAQRFELNLYATDGGTLPLNTPVTVTINVSGLLDLTPSFDHWPYLAYLDEKTGEWQPVLVRADADAGTLTAQVEHFSVWETGMAGALKSGWHLLYNAPQVSTFSGAASFSYPIEVLPGAGGMQPQVSLSYNSRRVDGIMSWIQSDWAGLGWSVDTIEVVRKVGREATYNSYQNKFTLLLNGTSYQLIKDSGYSAAYGRYYTADYSGLHIMRCNDFSTAITECATIPANNLTGEFWIIRTPQGLTYRLGDTAGSEQVIGGMYWWGGEYFTGGQRADADYYAGHASGYVTYRWRARQVKDNFNHTLDYDYAESNHLYYTAGDTSLQTYDKGYNVASYLSGIRYNYSAKGHDKVVFVRAQRAWDLSVGPVENCPGTLLWQNDYLSAIQVLHNGTLVRQYNLGYDVLRGPSVPDYATPSLLLNNITEYYPNQPAALPATTFVYAQQLSDDGKHGNKYACWWHPELGGDCGLPANQGDWTAYHWAMQPWWQSAFPHYRLAQVSNGYGGVTQFNYARDGHGNKNTPHSYIVTEARTLDGLGHIARTTYTYANGCWDHNGQPCYNPNGSGESKTLTGYGQVTVDQYDYDSAKLSRQVYFYHLDYQRLGRAYNVRTYAPDGTTLLAQNDTAWGTRNGYRGTLTYAGQTLETTYAAGLPATVRTDYTYDSYGNVVAEYQYGAEERVLNGGFEAGQAGWNFYWAPTLPASVVEAVGFAGYRSLKLENASTSGGAFQDVEGLESGQTYTVRVWVKGANISTARFRLWLHDTTGANVITSDKWPGSDWESVTLNYTANATGKVRVHLHLLAGSGTIYVDAVSVSRVADVGDERSVHRSFYNLDGSNNRWLLGLQWSEDVWQGISRHDAAVNNVWSKTRWFYDTYITTLPQNTAVITAGRVTRVGQGYLAPMAAGAPVGPFVYTTYIYDAWGNVTSATDPNGNVTTTNYDGTYHWFPVKVCGLNLCTETYYYGVNPNASVPSGGSGLFGQVQCVKDANEVRTAYSYDAYGRLVKVLMPGDVGWADAQVSGRNSYVSDGIIGRQRIINYLGQNGILWQETYYDGLGRTIQVHQKADNGQEVRTTTQYNALGQAVKTWVPYYGVHGEDGGYGVNGYVPASTSLPHAVTQYDALGRVTQVTAPDGTASRTLYNGWQTTAIDANNHQRVSTVDAYGQLVRVQEYTGAYPNATLYATTHYAYDTLGNLLTVTDALGNVTTMSYDVLGRRTGMNDRDMGTWSYQYDPAGNLTQQTDARSCVTTFSYDGLNRLTSKVYSGSLSQCNNTPDVTYTYDTFASGSNYGKGRRTAMSDTSGGSTTWTYDERGRVKQEIKVINGGGTFKTEWGYDSLDRVTWMKYPSGNTGGLGEQVNYTYAANGALNSVAGTNPYVQSTAYNALGQTTQMNLGNGTLTRWGYRGLGGNWDTPPTAGLTGYGRLYRIRTTAPYGEPLLDLRYGYDAVGNVTRIVDTPRQAANWPTSGFTFQDTFNSKNTTNWTWSAHQTVPYSDGGNNVVRNVGTGSNYDANFYRNAYSLINGKGLQLRFKVSQTDTGAVFAIEANDSTSRRFGVIADAGKLYVQYRDDGTTWRYPADLLTNLQVNTWYVLRIVVDDSGRGFYIEAYQENNPTVRGSYNITMPTGKSWRFHHWIYRGTAYIDDYREFNTSGLSWTPDERMGFTYDALDRLVEANPVNGGQGYNQTYQYDAIGNLTNKSDMGSYYYLDAAHKHAVTHLNGTTSSYQKYRYDANGNQTTRKDDGSTLTLTYDAENRLTTVNGGISARFTYDGDGNRVKSVMGGVTTYYVGNYFEWTGSTTSMVKYYYAGSQRVAMRQGSSTLFYLSGDHLGSTSLTTNSSGGKVAELRYHPWGGTRFSSGTTPTSYQFTGQRNDYYIKLYHMGARMYDPELGRFISPDSIVPDFSNPQSLNRYSYVYNDPLKYTDPSGHNPLLATAALGFAVGFGLNLATQTIKAARSGEYHSVKEVLGAVDLSKVVAAGVGGAVMGGTLGIGTAVLGTTILGTGIGTTLISGAVAGMAGGQANALSESIMSEGWRVLNGEQWNNARFMQIAKQNGVGNLEKMGIDAISGMLSAGLGRVVTTKLISAGLLPKPAQGFGVPAMTLEINSQGVGHLVADGVKLQIPMSIADQIYRALATGTVTVLESVLEEWSQNIVAGTLESASSP